jgi:hypothetical protein
MGGEEDGGGDGDGDEEPSKEAAACLEAFCMILRFWFVVRIDCQRPQKELEINEY